MDRTTMPREILAYLLTTALFAAALLPLLRPVFQRWLRLFWSSRLRAALSLALLLAFVYIGGTLDKQNSGGAGPSLRTGGSPALPLFYYDLGYPTADTDGDGIPDYWERRTHTNRLVPDSAADYDHDGVDNAEEFLYQCDPLTKDTDGDGLTDREEIDGSIAGMAGFDPLARCDFPEDASDAEAWGTGWNPVRFVGANGDGFPLNVGYPDEADGNVDVLLTVDSSRYAVLSWEDGFGPKELLLPPCTNLPLRLRVPAMESSSVSLSAAARATGLWKAALRAEWDARRGLDIERNRVKSASGWLVDAETSPAVFSGVLPGTFDTTNGPMRSGGLRRQSSNQNAPLLSLSMYARRAFEIEMSATCRIHGPNPTFQGAFTNAVSPFLWTVNGQDYTTPDPVLTVPLAADEYHVGCFDSGGYSLLPLGTNAVFHVGQCQGGPVTNFVGACWLSTHNPTNAADHLPGVEEFVEQYGPMCPAYTNTLVLRGFLHVSPPDVRNLARIVTGNVQDDETDHCLGLLWTTNLVIRLSDFLAPPCPFDTSQLSFSIRTTSSATITTNTIEKIPKPEDLWPAIFHVELRDSDTTRVLDRCWIVVCAPETKTLFDDWFSTYSSNIAWTQSLPPPPAFLILDAEGNATLPLSAISTWHSPKRLSPDGYIHHAASYELRSIAIPGGYGYQATYDSSGLLITNTISAGTADYRSPTGTLMFGRKEDHRVADMLPFVRALQLDGNPILMDNSLSILRENLPLNLDRPCLRQGPNTDKYIQLRPTIPTGILP